MPGAFYFVSMLIGAITVFLVAREPISYGIGAATILLLLAGYGVGRIPQFGRGGTYLETTFFTLTTFLLMVPSVSETLRRVPDGHPLVNDPKSPLLLGAIAGLFVMLVIGLIAQIIYLRRKGWRAADPSTDPLAAER